MESAHYQIAGTEVYLTEIAVVVAVLALIGLFAICMKPFLQQIQTALGILLVMGVVLIAALVTPHVQPQELMAWGGTIGTNPFHGILSIVILAPWAFVGFEVISLETAHFRFRVEKAGRLITFAILMGGCIYVVLALTAIVSQPENLDGWQAYVQSLDQLDGIASVPTFFVLQNTLGTFGAIVGFGYVSAATYRAAKRENSRRGKTLGTAGVILAAGFAAAQLIPGISLIETMKAESYLLLAFWCLLGFAFYWRTMRADPHESQRNETLTIAALFFLLIFSVVIWYIKMIIRLTDNRAPHAAVVCCSVILLSVILLGLVVMLLIHSKLQEKQMLLEREKIRAIENSQAKSRFLFNMSHDIRAPMNAVIGYANLALKEPVGPAVKSYLEKINLSSYHMLSLINDNLVMSRIESGKLELREKPVNMGRIVGEIGDLFSEQMRQKGITFEVNAADIENSCAYCDKKNLTRVLLNLVSNAYKFTPKTAGSRWRCSNVMRRDTTMSS